MQHNDLRHNNLARGTEVAADLIAQHDVSTARLDDRTSNRPPPRGANRQDRAVTMHFLDAPERRLSVSEFRDNDITRYQVTAFYRRQIQGSGYWDQLKHIVEPSVREFTSPGSLDTSGEHENTVVPGLQHKYRQTGLLLVTDRCASYCRYCFRKRLVGNDSAEIAPDYAKVAEYIAAHPEMDNVLMSGGDPFVLSTKNLHLILDHLLPIPHLRSIRFGTKTTAFYPPRFSDPKLPELFWRIQNADKAPIVVSHFDHVGEISAESEEAIRRLRGLGVQFLNQGVLLGRVNDDPDVLVDTMTRLHNIGARPYYLFQGRPVRGASHFQVPIRRGVEIVRAVQRRLPGIEKTFRYVMSHVTGKIEILGMDRDRVIMRQHQSTDPARVGEVFSRRYVEGACWLDDLQDD